MKNKKICDNAIWKRCKRDAKRCRNKREYVTSGCTYYDSVNGVIRIGNDRPEIQGRPCASPLELSDDMKNKIRAKKFEKNIEKN
jgi:hypothetical protein